MFVDEQKNIYLGYVFRKLAFFLVNNDADACSLDDGNG